MFLCDRVYPFFGAFSLMQESTKAIVMIIAKCFCVEHRYHVDHLYYAKYNKEIISQKYYNLNQ